MRCVHARAGRPGEQSGEAAVFTDVTNIRGAAFPSTAGSERNVTEVVLALTEITTSESDGSKRGRCCQK